MKMIGHKKDINALIVFYFSMLSWCFFCSARATCFIGYINILVYHHCNA